eukprot:196340_1
MDQIHEHRNQTTKVFVGGLHDDTAEAELSEYFTQFGEVLEVNVMYDRFTNAPRGFGFVTFKEADVAHKVITYDQDHMIHTKKVDCKPATARKDAFKRYDHNPAKDKATSREERWRQYHGDAREMDPNYGQMHAPINPVHHTAYAQHYPPTAHSSYAHSSYHHDMYSDGAPRYAPHSSSYGYPPPAHAPHAHHVAPYPPTHAPPPHYPHAPHHAHYDPYYRPPPHHPSYPPIAQPQTSDNK